MSTMTIKTNNHVHSFLYGYELTEKERAEFDYMTDEEIDESTFLRYCKSIYALSDFMRIDPPIAPHCQRSGWENWDGYLAYSFSSGVLIRIVEHGESYQIATFYS